MITRRRPLVLFAAALVAMAGHGTQASAAPSTYLDTEIQVPLELNTSFVLVHQATGHLRFIEIDAGNNLIFEPGVPSGLPDVTGVTSGLRSGANEALVLASANSNRLAFFDLFNKTGRPLFPDEPGPALPTFVRKSGVAPRDLHIAHTFNAGGDTLTHYRDPAGAFNPQDMLFSFAPVPSYQPFYDNPAGARFAAGVANDGLATRLFHTHVSAADTIDGSFGPIVPEDTLLATNVRRIDTALMLVGYVRGEKDLSLVPIVAPPTLGAVTTMAVPFPIGSVAPAAGGIDGILVTAADGSIAVHYRIDPGNNLIPVETFPMGADPIKGLVPVPGRGIVSLSGPAGKPSQQIDFFVWNGGGWDLKAQDALPALPLPQPNFATLFWFSSEPLVDPSALLIDMEVNPDWTSKSDPNPIPVNILTETYAGSTSGLDNPVPMLPAPPAGASHLVTNQFIDSISLSALDDTLALILPSLQVQPASGSYQNPIEIDVQFDSDTTEVFYRKNEFGAMWVAYENVIPVGYDSSYQFYARNLLDGVSGPIITRDYDFATGDLLSFDSDGDGIPDFVEIFRGLDPRGGADTDGDGFTDLDELLDGSDPNDPASTPATPIYPFGGEGFKILAQATDTAAGEASDGDPGDPGNGDDGEPIDLHGMTSNLLGSAPVEPLAAPVSLAGQLAADLSIGSPVPENHWLVLNSPQYFNLDGLAPEVRGGREIYKVLPRPVQEPPVIAPLIGGSDLDADAAAWLAAAATAYAGYEQVSTITPLAPIDTALAVVCEAALYDGLLNLDPSDQAALGVPQDIPADPGPPAIPAIPGYQQFTLFGNRDGDAQRTPLSDAMRDALIRDGIDLQLLFANLDNAVVGSSPNLLALTLALYDFHVAHSEPTAPEPDVIPLLPLPLDVLRELVRGGNLHADYAGVVPVSTVDDAKVELADALALLAASYRPTDTWTVEVAAPTVPGEAYSYTNLATNNPVAFYEADGDRVGLDQGLGLALGMRFSVTGYTDVSGLPGHDAMELLTLNVVFVPAATDTDTDGNLLADDWEEFFFGDTGVVGPFDQHPVHGFSYLQLFLIGHDPRDECTEVPAVAMVSLAPQNICLVRLPNSNLGISFTFPDAFISHFDFGANQTETLTGFAPFAADSLSNPAPDQYVLDLGPVASVPERNFFQLQMSLK